MNIVATTDFVNGKIQDVNNRIDGHKYRYGQDYFILNDTVNGFEYIVEMQNGNLVSYCKCVSIRVDKLPDKTTGIFDPTGMIVVAVCKDGSTREITNIVSFVLDNGIVTITYNEAGQVYTTTFRTEMISTEKALIDFEYKTNNDGTYMLTSWKGTLNGIPSTEIIVPDSNLIIVEVV